MILHRSMGMAPSLASENLGLLPQTKLHNAQETEKQMRMLRMM